MGSPLSDGRRVLVVAPHGLDELLGCAGTIASHVANGDEVSILSMAGDGAGPDESRRANGRRVAVLLGTAEPLFGGFPENRTDLVAMSDLVGWLERHFAAIKPQILYVSHAGNLNIDHQRCHHAALTAARPLPNQTVRAIYAFETASSTDWAPQTAERVFLPTRFVDIDAFWEKKRATLEIYAADMRPFPHARSIEALEALAIHRGAGVGLAKAEAFMVLRELIA